jgi:hypothetical protein
MNPFLALAERWKTEAHLLRTYADDQVAGVCDLHAAQVKQAWEEWQDEALTLDESARESGYTSDHLGRQVRAGSIPNAGRPNSPRIRRGHLPRKPGHIDSHCHTVPVDCREQIARSVADSSKGERDG